MKQRLEIAAHLAAGATLITPNNRLSAELHAFFLNETKHRGNPVSEKPRCMPYQTYLQTLFQQYSDQNPAIDSPILLTVAQQRHLWTQIIHQDQPGSGPGLLDEIEEAWSRCRQWQIDFNHPAFDTNPQTKLFQQWVFAFESKLRQLSCISSEHLVEFLIAHPLTIQPGTILWYCFEDYTPEQRALQQTLITRGCSLKHLDLDEDLPNVSLCKARDDDDEYQQLIHWLKICLSRGDKRIGIVVPDLQVRAEKLQRRLQHELPDTPCNISLGQSLDEFSIVSHALCWLNLKIDSMTLEETCLLLYSPFLAFSESERASRMQRLEDCPALQEEIIDVSLLLSELEKTTPNLVSLLKQLEAYPREASVRQWIALFFSRLKQLGFPGECQLNSASWQCYQRFLQLFDEFRALSLLTPIMSRDTALSSLATLARRTVFQPRSMDAATVWVSGLLEATGSIFDSLWVTGMTDECLPRKTRPSAFIPLLLQREYKMPYADSARELLLAQTLLQRLQKSSHNTIFSYPRLTQDRPNLVCPLLSTLPTHSQIEPEVISTSAVLERQVEDYQHPLSMDDTPTGGSALLANQAKCPFRALVAHRLHVRSAQTVSDGPSALERGKVIHKIMEILWRDLKTQQGLLSKPQAELDSLIQSAIHSALQPYIHLRRHSFPEPVQQVETNRLKQLIHACLEWEKQRQPFEVEALEQPFSLLLENIRFDLRIDRLDQVAGAKKWVIDYKSSLPATLPWNEDRPREPQLLMYALLDDTIHTLLFAQLKEGQISIKGVSDEPEDNSISNLKKGDTWQENRDRWETILQGLAKEYRQGHCPPRPAAASICQQCGYQRLCRYNAARDNGSVENPN